MLLQQLLLSAVALLLVLPRSGGSRTDAAADAADAPRSTPEMEEYTLGAQGRVVLRIRPDPWELEVVTRSGGGKGMEEEERVAFRTVLSRRCVFGCV